ncbi:thioredoxin family protein [Rhodoferax sp.]|jgi:thiol-disulfide isomerase/thioredoxin|uniref:thioredoxin family protein n=1 Tax=Rhodoferax sp. TaxID=50421 RepID=UPI003783A009
MSSPPKPDALLVACLCAQWCSTCREYQPLFSQLQAEYAHAQFVWIDIEDQADLVDPLEVDNFPTLLIASGGQARFFGTLTPHIETLRRLLQTQSAAPTSTVRDTGVHALVARLMARRAPPVSSSTGAT